MAGSTAALFVAALGVSIALTISGALMPYDDPSSVGSMRAASTMHGQKSLQALLSQETKKSSSLDLRSTKRGLARKTLLAVDLSDQGCTDCTLSVMDDLPCSKLLGCCWDTCTDAEKLLGPCAPEKYICTEDGYGSAVGFIGLPGLVVGILSFFCGLVFWITRGACSSCGCCGGCCGPQKDKGFPCCFLRASDGVNKFAGYTNKQIWIPRIIMLVLGVFTVISMGLGFAGVDEFEKGVTDFVDIPFNMADDLLSRAESINSTLIANPSVTSLVPDTQELQTNLDTGADLIRSSKSTFESMLDQFKDMMDMWGVGMKLGHGVSTGFIILGVIGMALAFRFAVGRFLLVPACVSATLIMGLLWLIFSLHLIFAVALSDTCDSFDDSLVYEGRTEYTLDGVDYTVQQVYTPLYRDSKVAPMLSMCADEFVPVAGQLTQARQEGVTEATTAYNTICATSVDMGPLGTVSATCTSTTFNDTVPSSNLDNILIPDLEATAACTTQDCVGNVGTVTIQQCADSTQTTGPCQGDSGQVLREASTEFISAVDAIDVLVDILDNYATPLAQCVFFWDAMFKTRTHLCVDALVANEFLLAANAITASCYMIVGIVALKGLKRFNPKNARDGGAVTSVGDDAKEMSSSEEERKEEGK